MIRKRPVQARDLAPQGLAINGQAKIFRPSFHDAGRSTPRRVSSLPMACATIFVLPW
jgi:hypothetical protein